MTLIPAMHRISQDSRRDALSQDVPYGIAIRRCKMNVAAAY